MVAPKEGTNEEIPSKRETFGTILSEGGQGWRRARGIHDITMVTPSTDETFTEVMDSSVGPELVIEISNPGFLASVNLQHYNTHTHTHTHCVFTVVFSSVK